MARLTILSAIVIAVLTLAPFTLAADPLSIAVYSGNQFWPMLASNDGEFSGFEPDLARALCATMNSTCIFVPVDTLDERLTAVADGSADFGISLITVTEERAQTVDFVQPYYYSSGFTVFTTNGTDLASGGWDGLSGKTVCSETGYYGNDILPEMYNVKIKIMPWTNTTTDAQRTTDVETAVGSTCVGYLSDSTAAEAFGMVNSQLPALAVEPYGIVTAIGNDALEHQLSAALVVAMGNGSDSEILKLEAQDVVANGVPANAQLPGVVAAISDFDVDAALAPTPAPTPPPSGAAALKGALAAAVCAFITVAMA